MVDPGAVRSEGGGPVVICCAEADAAGLAPLKRELESEGHLVEIVAGVENDTEPLGTVIDQCHGEGLYVLCRSKALDRAVVDRCREVLLARHVPFGRTITVASIRPRELRDRIHAGLKRVAAGRARSMRHIAPDGSRPIRVPRTTQRGLPLVAPGAPATARPGASPATAGPGRSKRRRHPTHLGIPVPPQPPATKKKTADEEDGERTAPRTLPPAAARAEPTPAGAAPERGTPERAPASPSMVVPDDDPLDSFEDENPTNVNKDSPAPEPLGNESTSTGLGRAVDTTSVDQAPALRAARNEQTSIGPAPHDDSGEIGFGGESNPITLEHQSAGTPSFYDAVEAIESEPIDVRDLYGDNAPGAPPPVVAATPAHSGPLIRPEDLADLDKSDPIELSASDMEVLGIKQPPLPGNRTGNTSVSRIPEPILSGHTDRAIVLDPEEVVTQKNPVARPKASPSSRPTDAPVPRDVPLASTSEAPEGREEIPWKVIGLGAAALVVGVAVAWGLTDSKTSDVREAVSRIEDKLGTDAKNGDAAASVEPQPEAPPQPEPPVATTPGQVRTKVMDALRSRKVRALDVLLVTANTEGPMSLEDAQMYCGALYLEDLGGWRLPEVGELASLTEANMLGRGYYWSATPADTFGDLRLGWWGRRQRVVTRTADSLVVCVRGNRVAD